MKNRTPVPRGTDVLFSYMRWSADESDFRENLVASMSEMCFCWAIKADIHFGLIVPRRLPTFLVIQFIGRVPEELKDAEETIYRALPCN